jgi:hypothetical protein
MSDPIEALGPKACKWPVGEANGGTIVFCGEKRLVIGLKVTPYCEKHYHQAYPRSSHQPSDPPPRPKFVKEKF